MFLFPTDLNLLIVVQLVSLVCLSQAFLPIVHHQGSRIKPVQSEIDADEIHANAEATSIRKPRGYWLDLSNIESELRYFWKSINVQIKDSEPPPIPNEALLIHFDRHDLRHGIYSQGGRQFIAEILGGARIIPGKWGDAVQTSPELEQLLMPTNPKGAGLSKTIPPMPSHVKKKMTHSRKKATQSYYENRWSHKDGRNPKGHWSEEQVLSELYRYLQYWKTPYERPSVWMPRLSELSKNDHDDLRQAITRFIGGKHKISKTAGLIPYQEWKFFEDQLLLFVKLKQYIEEHPPSNYDDDDMYITSDGQVMNENERDSNNNNNNNNNSKRAFPRMTEIKKNGETTLHNLIRQYGGQKFVASRLSMPLTSTAQKSTIHQELQWGSFDLDFAVDLLTFVKKKHMGLQPPLEVPLIRMPGQEELIREGEMGKRLALKIKEFGGYENVARRLGLAYFEAKKRRRY